MISTMAEVTQEIKGMREKVTRLDQKVEDTIRQQEAGNNNNNGLLVSLISAIPADGLEQLIRLETEIRDMTLTSSLHW